MRDVAVVKFLTEAPPVIVRDSSGTGTPPLLGRTWTGGAKDLQDGFAVPTAQLPAPRPVAGAQAGSRRPGHRHVRRAAAFKRLRPRLDVGA
ncbi:hypothetical protein [Arthrobacter globiformis]|uniref:hypothetical protein n=1 Tax=Arthrobacter globiformis TaxID=1665 RepID=UPI0011B9448E|nr:hypothetical protein [Arthrobacter globiformis]